MFLKDSESFRNVRNKLPEFSLVPERRRITTRLVSDILPKGDLSVLANEVSSEDMRGALDQTVRACLNMINGRGLLRGGAEKIFGALTVLGTIVSYVSGSEYFTASDQQQKDLANALLWAEFDEIYIPTILFPCVDGDCPELEKTYGPDEDDSIDERQTTDDGHSARMLQRGIELVDPAELRRMPADLLRSTSKLSELSYRSIDQIETIEIPEFHEFLKLQADGFPIFVESERSFDTQAYVWLCKGIRTVFVSFRGTNSLTDIRYDLDVRLIQFDESHPDIKVHAGFRDKFKSVQGQILSLLDQHRDMFGRIVLTGHSLGGALATLAGPVLGEHYPTKAIECLTFGSPRVGDQGFVNWFKRYVDFNLRLLNDGDPVAAFPYRDSFLHVSEALSMSRSGQLRKVPEIPANKRLLHAIEDFDLKWFTEEHNIGTYIKRLDALASDSD